MELPRRLVDESVAETDGWGCDPEAVAVLLFTSSTAASKAAVLHRNLAAYLVGSLEFGGAGTDERPWSACRRTTSASVSSALSTTCVGRRVVQLEQFEPAEWVRAVRDEAVTHAMVVP